MKTKLWCGLTAIGASVATLTALPSWADQATPAAKPNETSSGCSAASCKMTRGTAAQPDETYTGTVMAVNPNGRTLEVKEFLFSKKFNLGDKCAYELWDKPAGTISDLRPGEKVTVSYQDASGVLVADRIKQDPMTETGRIEAVDPAKDTLTLHSGWTDKTFQVPGSCLVMLRDSKSGSLANLQPGYYVTVTYELPQDKAVAREVAQTGTTFTGKLTAVDLDSRTVKATSLFDTKQFDLADNCAILINGKPNAKLSNLRLGEELTVSYNDVNGIDIANTIAGEPATHRTETTSARPMSSYSPKYEVP